MIPPFFICVGITVWPTDAAISRTKTSRFGSKIHLTTSHLVGPPLFLAGGCRARIRLVAPLLILAATGNRISISRPPSVQFSALTVPP